MSRDLREGLESETDAEHIVPVNIKARPGMSATYLYPSFHGQHLFGLFPKFGLKSKMLSNAKKLRLTINVHFCIIMCNIS